MILDVDNFMGRAGASPHQVSPCRSHLTSHPRTRKGNTNGKTVEQGRKTASPSRLSATEEKRCQSRKALTIEFHHRDTGLTEKRQVFRFFLRVLCAFAVNFF